MNAELDQIFFALSDSTRRGILAQLAEGESTVAELAAPYDMSAPAISKHLKILERAGLLVRRIDGVVHRCNLNPEALQQAANWVETYKSFWTDRFAALEGVFSNLQTTQTPPKSNSNSDGKKGT